MAGLNTQCPHCRVKIRLKNPDFEGQTVECPSCSEPYVVKRLVVPTPAARKPAPKSSGSATPGKTSSPATVKKQAVAKKASRKDIDFPVDDEILEADEVIEEAGGDDDWLDELDSLAPKGPVVSKSGGAPAPVKGRPKKRSTQGTRKKRRRSLRDPDGELPLWMSRLIMIGTGIAAGALCVVVWAAMISTTGSRHPYMAMAVGGLVGAGVRLGASKWDFGWFPAVTAALIALFAIIGGKVYAVNMRQELAIELELVEAKARLAMAQHEDYPLYKMAEEIHLAMRDDGFDDTKTLHSIIDMIPKEHGLITEEQIIATYDPERLPEVYGETRWNQARQRWAGITEEHRKEVEEEIALDIEHFTRRTQPEGEAELRKDAAARLSARGGAIGVTDFIFAIIALVGAFKLAAGMSGGDEQY